MLYTIVLVIPVSPTSLNALPSGQGSYHFLPCKYSDGRAVGNERRVGGTLQNLSEFQTIKATGVPSNPAAECAIHFIIQHHQVPPFSGKEDPVFQGHLLWLQ